MPDLTGLASDVDQLLHDRALVFGSLPSDAHDLDLLVRAAAVESVPAALRAGGFTGDEQTWLRVSGGTTHVVDVVDVATWALPPHEIDALFTEAKPLRGLRHVCEPAPHHRLLILARRLVPAGGTPDESKLTRVQRALDADPAAASKARDAAERWRCRAELDVLLDVHRTRRAITRREAWTARVSAETRLGRPVPVAAATLVLRRLRRLARSPSA